MVFSYSFENIDVDFSLEDAAKISSPWEGDFSALCLMYLHAKLSTYCYIKNPQASLCKVLREVELLRSAPRTGLDNRYSVVRFLNLGLN